MLRNRFVSTAAYFMAPPDGPGAAASGTSPGSVGSPPSPGSSGGSTSSPAPAATPASTPSEPSAPSVPAAAEAPDFMSIFDGPPSDEVPPSIPGTEVPLVTPPAATVPAAAPATAPAPAATPAAAQPPTTVQPAGPGDGGQPPAATPQPSGAVLDPYDPAGLANAILQNEQATIDHVASTMFQLSPEDMQALETDVAGTVPKLLAKAFVKTQINAMMQLSRIIPEMVRRSTADMRNHTENEGVFYARWPQIEKAKYQDLVNRFGITYRQMNPTATRDQMIEELGPLIMMAAKIPLTAVPAVPNGGVAQPQNGGRAAPAHQPSPFTPATPGPAASVQAPELAPWETMFQPQD